MDLIWRFLYKIVKKIVLLYKHFQKFYFLKPKTPFFFLPPILLHAAPKKPPCTPYVALGAQGRVFRRILEMWKTLNLTKSRFELRFFEGLELKNLKKFIKKNFLGTILSTRYYLFVAIV